MSMMMSRTPTSAKKIPLNKENREAPTDKKRKIGRDIFGVRVMSEPRVRVRQAFSSVNSRIDNDPSTATPNSQPEFGSGCETASTAITTTISTIAATTPIALSKEDIDALINLKMKGKTKFDFKGKSEQMMDYIKRLRACIRALQESEASQMSQKEALQNQLQEERQDRNLSENRFKLNQEELEKSIFALKVMQRALEERLHNSEAQTESLLQDREKDLKALEKAKKEIDCMKDECENSRKDSENAAQQVVALQDINKRLQEYNTSLQTYNSKLQTDAAAVAENLCRIQKEKSTMVETLSSLRGQNAALQEQLNQSKASLQDAIHQRKLLIEEKEKLQAELQKALDHHNQLVTKLEMLTLENARLKESSSKSEQEVENLNQKATILEEKSSSQVQEIASLHTQLDTVNRKLQVAENAVLEYSSMGAEKMVALEELQKLLANAETRISEGELLRRKLHNTILELKGNIRVFCRVRPLLPDDESYAIEEPPAVQYPTSTELLGRGIELVQAHGQKYGFSFDKVFGPEVGQEDVFVEISQLIQSALDGYKVCIFAYGQTGSGKTHTMLGNPDDPNQRGVIPRSLEQIFEASQTLNAQGWSFRIQASMLEIYNETIRDLLAPNVKAEAPNKPFVVSHDQNGNTSVSDLTLVEVTTWKEVSSLLRRASQSRSVGKTAMNEQSSRSHCVFTLRISGLNERLDQEVHGVLNLIDLAGSERLSRSGSSGDRLKETQAINKSLACLGDVIVAIANRDQHIPYRNSKLTYLLQPCLGGNSKTLMFVNISPDAKSTNESLCSLRFASKVNACEIGVPRRNTQMRLNCPS